MCEKNSKIVNNGFRVKGISFERCCTLFMLPKKAMHFAINFILFTVNIFIVKW